MRRTLFLATLLLPTWARAEVLDKEFSLPTVLAVAVVAAVLAFRVARGKPWALAGLLPIVGTFFWLHLSELLDPFVGPAMAREGGQTYVIVSWVSPLLVVAAAVIGYVLRVLHAKSAL
jgi:lipopolysaccharide export LptBFGC system permease protein LptF